MSGLILFGVSTAFLTAQGSPIRQIVNRKHNNILLKYRLF